jgi:hypothetical protein
MNRYRTIERRELAHRTSDGIDVYLFWEEHADRVTVGVLDSRTDESFELEVDPRDAFDAFSHPYAYATRIDTADRGALAGGPPPHAMRAATRRKPTINPRRSDHASTDR